MSETTRRAAQIAAEAFERPTDQRRPFLDEACANDGTLRAEVESLLAADAEAGSFLDQPAVRGERAPDHDPLVGTTIDGFAILRRIAVGGMGAVYEAQQANPHRRVALKLVRPGAATPNALKRFEHEAHVLARLQHPGIAQIFDAGSFDAGQGMQPFFAMELIDGQPLTQYADAQKLHTRQRLELFAEICDAVHYAHQKGVIHRDLKPGNVLVDADGHPKVLDFGVARVTDADVQATTLHTQAGELLGTLPYMSPEQVLGDADGIDVRSDVYGLGVMLYELLSGKLPHDLHDKPVAEAARIIREDDVTPLSSINRIFRGDLETIVAKALDRDPERRYSSAAELAADARRYLNDEPITARPASALYQIRKFTRRHKAIVGGVAAAFVAMLTGTAVATYGFVQANEQRTMAETKSESLFAVNAFFNELLTAVDPENAQGREVTVREILDEAAARIDDEFGERPLVEAELRHTIGSTYRALGHYRQAQEHLSAGLELCERHLGDEDPRTIEFMLDLSALLIDDFKPQEAEVILQRAYEIRVRTCGPAHDETLWVLLQQVHLLLAQNRDVEAEPIARRVYETYQTRHGDTARTLAAMRTLAVVTRSLGKLNEAGLLTKRYIGGCRVLYGDDHPKTLGAINSLGWHLITEGRAAEAHDLFLDMLAAHERVFGTEHPKTLNVFDGSVRALEQLGSYREVVPMFRDLLERRRNRFGDGYPRVAYDLHHLADALQRINRLEEAEGLARDAVIIYRRTPHEHADEHSHAIQVLSSILVRRGDRKGAEEAAAEAVALGKLQGEDHRYTLAAMSTLADQYYEQGRNDEALTLYLHVLERRRELLGAEHPLTLHSLSYAGWMYHYLQRYEEAEELYRDELEIRRRVFGEEHPATLLAMYNLGCQLADTGRLEDAREMFATAVAASWKPGAASLVLPYGVTPVTTDSPGEGQTLPVSNYSTGQYLVRLGRCLGDLERFAEGEEALLEGCAILDSHFGAESDMTTKAVQRLAELYEAWGKQDDAERYRAMLPVSQEALGSEQHHDAATSRGGDRR